MGYGAFAVEVQGVSAFEKETTQTRVLMPSPSLLLNAVSLNQVGSDYYYR